MNRIEPLRHQSVFSPAAFGKRRVDVIGAGATGSKVALSLAKLGIENLHVWDFDAIEEHNIANQVYKLSDIGESKVVSLANIIEEQTGLKISAHNERVPSKTGQKLGDVVFLLTDTMASRKEIWSKCIKFKIEVKLMIETRMGIDEGRVYTINPLDPADVKGWESTLYDDKEAPRSACGATSTVGPTADVLAGLAVWQMVRWFSFETGKAKDDIMEKEILFSLRPSMILSRNF
jgi:molybdopterin/thiamine biosynthesis adenylyltransferase